MSSVTSRAGARVQVVGIGIALGFAIGALPAAATGASVSADDRPATPPPGAAAAEAAPDDETAPVSEERGLLTRLRDLLDIDDSETTPAPAPAPASAPAAGDPPARTPAGPPSPTPDPSAGAVPAAAGLAVAGDRLIDGEVPYAYAGLTATTLAGCPQVPAATRAEADAVFAALPPRTMTRVLATTAQDLDDLRVLVDAAQDAGQLLTLVLATGDGTCGATEPAPSWYDGGYRSDLLPWVDTVAAAFADSPAVGMWEVLARPEGADPVAVRTLADDAAAAVRARVASPVVTASVGSGYSPGDLEVVFGGAVDVVAVHDDSPAQPGDLSPAVAAGVEAAAALDKPMVVGEVGLVAGPGCRTTPAERATALSGSLDGYLAAGAAGVSLRDWAPAAAATCSDANLGPGDPALDLLRGPAAPPAPSTTPTTPATEPAPVDAPVPVDEPAPTATAPSPETSGTAPAAEPGEAPTAAAPSAPPSAPEPTGPAAPTPPSGAPTAPTTAPGPVDEVVEPQEPATAPSGPATSAPSPTTPSPTSSTRDPGTPAPRTPVPAPTGTFPSPATEGDTTADAEAAGLLEAIRDLLGLGQDPDPGELDDGAAPAPGPDPTPPGTPTPSSTGPADPSPAPSPDDGSSSAPDATGTPASPSTTGTPPAPSPPGGAGGDGAGAPFAQGRPYVDPASDAALAASAATDPDQRRALERLAAEGHATWVGGWTPQPTEAVRAVVDAAATAGQTPFFAVYNVPNRDCAGGYSAGGATTAGEYTAWVEQVAAGLTGSSAVVVLEPDALPSLDCLSPDAQAERLDLLAGAGAALTAAGATVYLDAGVPRWQPVDVTAHRLQAAGVDQVRGFALNVANYASVADNVAYGDAITAALGGRARYLIDTSRNGAGPAPADPGTEAAWCNPDGRAVGPGFTTDTPSPSLDALAWVKVPGASDGTCNGGAPAGTFMPDRAADLARAIQPDDLPPATRPGQEPTPPLPAPLPPQEPDDAAALLARLRELLTGT